MVVSALFLPTPRARQRHQLESSSIHCGVIHPETSRCCASRFIASRLVFKLMLKPTRFDETATVVLDVYVYTHTHTYTCTPSFLVNVNSNTRHLARDIQAEVR